MTVNEAVARLQDGGAWSELVEAIGAIISSPESTPLDVLHGLRHGGLVGEQAALALYKRTGRSLPVDRRLLEQDYDSWLDYLTNPEQRIWRTESRESNGVADEIDLFRQVLGEAVTWGLSRQERLVLVLYYFEQMLVSEIAAVLSLSASRVSEVHCDILIKLKRRLSMTTERLIRDLVATR